MPHALNGLLHGVHAAEGLVNVHKSYCPGKEQAHVGQAFQPDVSILSGWKA